jgi:hypothetical protein
MRSRFGGHVYFSGCRDPARISQFHRVHVSAANLMIISHKYKFIFIKTVKTAGTSIEVFLSPLCGAEDVVTPIYPALDVHEPRNFAGFVNPLAEIRRRPEQFASILWHTFSDRKFYNHMPATLVRERMPSRTWKGYFKSCVERNPWDKVLSHYQMQLARRGRFLSLDQYLANARFPINYPRYTDASGKRIIVDRVLRYENLDAELADIFALLRLPFSGNLDVRAKSEYRSDRSPRHEIFNETQRRLIERAFAREIELFDYRFEEDCQADVPR